MAINNAKREPAVLGPNLAERILIIAPLSGLYRLILWVVKRLDDGVALIAVYILIWPVLLLFRGQRNINLRRLFIPRGKTAKQYNELSRQYVWHHAMLILEAARLSSMTPEQIRQRVVFHGEEHLIAALKKRRGVMLVGNHVGNWLFSAAFLSTLGYKVSGVVYEIPMKSIERHMKSLWHRYNLSVTTVGRGAPAAALRTFKRNEIFIALTDVSLRPIHGKWLRLGDAAINIDTGPAKLALMTDAPMLYLSNHRQPDSRIVVSISAEIERTNVGNDPTSLAQLWLQELYNQLLLWPDQWWLVSLIPLRIPTSVPLSQTTITLPTSESTSLHDHAIS